MLTPVSKPDRPSTSSGNARMAGPAMLPKPPPTEVSATSRRQRHPAWVTASNNPDADDDGVQQQEDGHQRNGHATASVKPSRKTPPRISSRTTVMGDGLAVQERRQVRVLQQVHGGVGGGQGDGDDPRGRDEPEQHQHEDLAAPERQQVLQHRHRALPVRALLRHPPVHRQHAQQRQGHDQQRGQRRQGPGGERGDAGQVGQRGEVVDAGQAHDLPPALLVRGALLGLRAHRLVHLVLQQPPRKPAAGAVFQLWGGHAGRNGVLGRCGHEVSFWIAGKACRRTAGGPGGRSGW